MPAQKEPRRDDEGSEPLPGFEAAYQELQQVVDRLDEGGFSIEEAVRLFERGVELANRCEAYIDRAELRVTRLLPGEVSGIEEEDPL